MHALIAEIYADKAGPGFVVTQLLMVIHFNAEVRPSGTEHVEFIADEIISTNEFAIAYPVFMGNQEYAGAHQLSSKLRVTSSGKEPCKSMKQ